jgi:hypothetical protein
MHKITPFIIVLGLLFLLTSSFAQSYQTLPSGGYIIWYSPAKIEEVTINGEVIKLPVVAEEYDQYGMLVSRILGPYW